MSIGAVIVTFNRLEKLKIALSSFEAQTSKPSYILVVDNASNDGTTEYLAEWEKVPAGLNKIVLRKDVNSGSSGGFHSGLEASLKLDADWVWVSDDDAFPEPDAFETIDAFISSNETESISAICSHVINCGKTDYCHRRRVSSSLVKIVEKPVPQEEYETEFFDLDEFSYVGAAIKKSAMETVGTTLEDYFIWYDDTEHSLRLRENGRIICLTDSIVHHDNSQLGSSVTWKTYYGERNRLDMIKRHFPKRFYYYHLLRSCMGVVKNLFLNRERVPLRVAAIHDVCVGKLGLHEEYRPGWKPLG